MPYTSSRCLRSKRDRHHYNFRKAIDDLASQARQSSQASVSFFHVIRCSYSEVPGLLAIIPYSWHLFESSNLHFNPHDETIVCIPYVYTRFQLVYTLIKNHLGRDPIIPHTQTLGSTYIRGRPSTHLYQWTQQPGQQGYISWEIHLPAVFNNHI